MNTALHRMIELHDTTVVAIAEVGEQIVVMLRAYVHQSEGRPGWDAGSGWAQAAALTFAYASVGGEIPDLPADVMEGDLIVDGEIQSNSIPIPFDHRGSISLVIQLNDSNTIEIKGTQATLTLLGDPVYIEVFPGSEQKPNEGA